MGGHGGHNILPQKRYGDNRKMKEKEKEEVRGVKKPWFVMNKERFEDNEYDYYDDEDERESRRKRRKNKSDRADKDYKWRMNQRCSKMGKGKEIVDETGLSKKPFGLRRAGDSGDPRGRGTTTSTRGVRAQDPAAFHTSMLPEDDEAAGHEDSSGPPEYIDTEDSASVDEVVSLRHQGRRNHGGDWEGEAEGCRDPYYRRFTNMAGGGGRGPGKGKTIQMDNPYKRQHNIQRRDDPRYAHEGQLTTSTQAVDGGKPTERLLAASFAAYHSSRPPVGQSGMPGYYDDAAFERQLDEYAGVNSDYFQTPCSDGTILTSGPGDTAKSSGPGDTVESSRPSDMEEDTSGHEPPNVQPEGPSNMVISLKGAGGRFISISGDGTEGFSVGGGAKKKQKKGHILPWVITGAMPGGPYTASLIPSYGGHIAGVIWGGKERDKEVIVSCTRKMYVKQLQDDLPTFPPAVVATIRSSPLSRMPGLVFRNIDHALIAAFVERWQPDTNSFHLPFGEMTIMLHDVQQILGLPVDGDLPPYVSKEEVPKYVEQIFGVKMEKLSGGKYIKGGILDTDLRAIWNNSNITESHRVRVYLFGLVGNTLIVDKSVDRHRPHAWASTENHDRVAWGAVALAYLYRQLGEASRKKTARIGGCLTLLQAWIYEYFPMFRPHHPLGQVDGLPRASLWAPKKEDKGVGRLKKLRARLDGLRPQELVWCPYGRKPYEACPRTLYTGCIRAYDDTECYMPVRVVRQLGFVQARPHRPARPLRAWRPEKTPYTLEFDEEAVSEKWEKFPLEYNLNVTVLKPSGTQPWATERDYKDWFYSMSHPLLVNANTPAPSTVVTPPAPEHWLQAFFEACEPVFSVRRRRSDTHVQLPVGDYDTLVSVYRSYAQTLNIPLSDQPEPINDDDDEANE